MAQGSAFRVQRRAAMTSRTAYNASIAAHPRLESIVLPILRDTIDGLAISIVR